MSDSSPIQAARMRQEHRELRRSTQLLASNFLANASVGDEISFEWRIVSDAERENAEIGWIKWDHGIIKTISNDEENHRTALVEWPEDLEDFSGENPLFFPPDPRLSEADWIFEMRKPILKTQDHIQRTVRPRPNWASNQHPLRESNKRARVEQRFEPNDEYYDSDAEDRRLDAMAGARVALRSVCIGLRIPRHIEQNNLVFYPNLWTSGDAWEIAMRAKCSEYCCFVRSAKIKDDLDLDIACLKELIMHRAGLEISKEQHRTTFKLMARIVSVIITTSPMMAQNSSDVFLAAFQKAFDEGRVEFDRLLAARAETKATTPQPPPALEGRSLVANDANYWKNQAEELHKSILRNNQQNNGHSNRQHRDFRQRDFHRRRNYKPYY